MNDLKNRWGTFLSIIFDPWTLVLVGSVVSLFTFSIGETNTTITSLVFVLITIASGILGGRITKHWVDFTESGVVIARGKSAVRSLKLLLRNISALEQRVAIFSSRLNEIEKNPEVTKRNYEEIREICNLLEEETVNSIENWTDIFPEEDIKTQIGVISELKESLQQKEVDLKSLNTKLDDAKGKSIEENSKLLDEVKKKERQIFGLERKITEKKFGLGGIAAIGGLSGISSTTIKSSLFGHGVGSIPGLISTENSGNVNPDLCATDVSVGSITVNNPTTDRQK